MSHHIDIRVLTRPVSFRARGVKIDTMFRMEITADSIALHRTQSKLFRCCANRPPRLGKSLDPSYHARAIDARAGFEATKKTVPRNSSVKDSLIRAVTIMIVLVKHRKRPIFSTRIFFVLTIFIAFPYRDK